MTAERDTASRAAAGPWVLTAPRDDPDDQQRRHEHGHEAERGVDGPGGRGGHDVAEAPGHQQHQPLAEHGGAQHRCEQREQAGRRGPVDAEVVLEQRRHEAHGEVGPAHEPHEPEHGRHETLAPAAPGVRGQDEDEDQVEHDRPAHSWVPRIHGDMTRSGSGRSRATSQGSARPARSKRLLSSIAVKPHTNRSSTSKAGPR